MSDTPIVDRRILQINAALKRPIDAPMQLDETARQLERMCNELATCLSRASFIQAGMHAKADTALARWQAMKAQK